MRRLRGGLFAWGILVLALLWVSVEPIAQETSSFSSVFDVAVSTNPSAAWHLDLSASLTAVYERGAWSTASQSLFDDSGWLRQWFQSRFSVGSAQSTVEITLLPSTAELDFAWLMLEMYMLGLQLDGGLTLEPDGAGGWVGLQGHDVAGLPVGLELQFGVDAYHNLIQTGCQVAFTGARAWTELNPLPACPDFYVRSELMLSDAGFESLEIDASLPELSTLPWLRLSPSLTFTLDEKTFELRAGITPGSFEACVDFFFYITMGGAAMPEIDDIVLSGFRIDCEIAGIEFTGDTRLDGGSSPRMFLRSVETNLTGGYFETYRIQSSQDGCCGPLEFELAAYFLEGGGRLLDLSAMQAQFMLQVTPLLKLGSAMEFDFEQAAGSQWVYWDIFAQVSF